MQSAGRCCSKQTPHAFTDLSETNQQLAQEQAWCIHCTNVQLLVLLAVVRLRPLRSKAPPAQNTSSCNRIGRHACACAGGPTATGVAWQLHRQLHTFWARRDAANCYTATPRDGVAVHKLASCSRRSAVVSLCRQVMRGTACTIVSASSPCAGQGRHHTDQFATHLWVALRACVCAALGSWLQPGLNLHEW